MTSASADELAIRHIVAAYADGVNRRDEATWADTWAEEGIWELPGGRGESGKDNVVKFWNTAMGAYEFVLQLVYNGTITLDGNTATGRWYLCEHLRPVGSDSGKFNIGTYADQYVRDNNQWLFAKRSYHVLYDDEGKGDMSGIAVPLPAP